MCISKCWVIAPFPNFLRGSGVLKEDVIQVLPRFDISVSMLDQEWSENLEILQPAITIPGDETTEANVL